MTMMNDVPNDEHLSDKDVSILMRVHHSLTTTLMEVFGALIYLIRSNPFLWVLTIPERLLITIVSLWVFPGIIYRRSAGIPARIRKRYRFLWVIYAPFFIVLVCIMSTVAMVASIIFGDYLSFLEGDADDE